MRLRVLHTTRYTYPTPATESQNELRLMPFSDKDQTCLDFRLSTTPPARLFAYDLPTGRVHYFSLHEPHSELTIAAESLVVTFRQDPFAGLQLDADDSAFYQREGVRQRYAEYLAPTERAPLHPETDRIAAVARRQAGVGTASFLIALTRLLHRAFAYAPDSTRLRPSLQRVLEQKQGALPDFTHLMLAICRRQGIPARYVSGYLYTGEPSPDTARAWQEPAETARFTATSATWGRSDAMHAWVECLLPDERWCGFDLSNNLLTNDAYIKVHYGRDYGDVPPVRGVYRGPFAHTLDVSVRVTLEK
ncbi:MAG TPA: transglutaminase family protein [Chthonomonadaceae bacterium]|nr:transglutaminase family protein [Chthonomonadaceae bacterium]